jgi:hypothetical protein
MKKLILAALLSFLFVQPALADANCVTADVFIKKQEGIIKTLFKLPDEYLPELSKAINANLEASGKQKTTISSFYVAILTSGNYGIAYFLEDGCLERKSVVQVTPSQFGDQVLPSLPILEKLEELVNG